ncbi:MAG: DUF3179 domain-containing protein [Phycisphaerales bacterium]|nr:DUF3179 domain-containing protein [Phycisphaerales bacterium]
MIVPVALVIASMLFAVAVAFGTHPNWADTEAGLELIYTARRLQWPLVVACIACCIGLIALVVSGRNRSWWLIALAPILGLFVYRFSTRSFNAFQILDNPVFLRASDADYLADDEMVVGLHFADEHYAYPFRLLYTRPVIIQTDRNQRLILFWSAFANRARAASIDRDLKARDLDIVSMPANALLVYNSRLGQFINGLTLRTRHAAPATGIGGEIPTEKMSWKRWRQLHPQTRVMAPLSDTASGNPVAAVLPYYNLPASAHLPSGSQTSIAVIHTDPPMAVPMDQIANVPLNFMAGSVPVLLLRDRTTDQIRAFDRRLEDDLTPYFRLNTDPRRKGVAMLDGDTTIGWSADGQAVDGDKSRRGFQLTELPVEPNLYWGVMKYWYPNLLLYQPPPAP